jgi:LysM repeat protein
MKIRNFLLAGISGSLLALVCVLALALQAGVAAAAAPSRNQAPADSGFITITVKSGDNLSKYTFRFGVTPSALVAANNYKDPNLIFPGQTVVIPVVKSFTPSLTTPFYYVVKSGDQLNTLARSFEMDPSVVAAANGLQNDAIFLGQTLLIPAGPHSHIAVAGETLKSIAARYGVAVKLLIDNNPGISNPDLIFSGQPIFIPILYGAAPVPLSGSPAPTAVPGTPAPTSTGGPAPTQTPVPSATPVGANNFIQVVVHPGESFVTYVARYGVSPHRLRNANQEFADPNVFFPGQTVIVPVVVSQTPSRTTPFFYVVKSGDTSASIAAKFEMDNAVLVAGNPGANFAVGSTILVPAGPHLYTVRPGDNIGLIATRYATTVAFLLTGNKLPDPGAIFPGQLIFVPLQIDAIPVAFN